MGNSSKKVAHSNPALRKAPSITYNPKTHRRQHTERKQRGPTPSYELIETNARGKPLREFFNKYELSTQVLGKGSYAEVRLATYMGTEDHVAVKIMNKTDMDDKDIDDVRREVAIMKSLKHKNIVAVHEYFEDDRFFYVVMEYISGGELFTGVEDCEDYTEKDTRDVMLTLLEAMLYCKNRGVAHRDIKPENILLRKRINHQVSGKDITSRDETGFAQPPFQREKSFKAARSKYEIAIADFGFAIQVSKSDLFSNALETQCGSPLFLAPEIIEEKKYNYKCDIWSLGVVCYMLLSGGHRPFDGNSREELFERVLKGKWTFKDSGFEDVSANAKNFVGMMLVNNPNKRASYEKLLDHPWFRDSNLGKSKVPVSVNFNELKKFNARRKMLRAVKARQAAKQLIILMNDLEKTATEDDPIRKYANVVRLSAFYKSPGLKTEAEKRFQRKQKRNNRPGRMPLPAMPPPGIPPPNKQPRITSAFFKDIDQDV